MSYTARSHQRTRRLLALLMVLHVPCVHAQRSGFRPGAIPDEASPVTTPHRTGISLGVYSIAAPGVTITGADVDGEFKTKSGGGAGVVLGIGVTPLLSVFASIDIAKQQSSAADYDGTFGLAHAEAGVQLNLATQGARTVPYLLGSIGRRGVGAKVFSVQDDADVDMTLYGRALSVGGGIQHYFSPHMALDAGIQYSTGSFDHFKSNGESSPLDVRSSTSVRARLGVTWHP